MSRPSSSYSNEDQALLAEWMELFGACKNEELVDSLIENSGDAELVNVGPEHREVLIDVLSMLPPELVRRPALFLKLVDTAHEDLQTLLPIIKNLWVISGYLNEKPELA
jgi:hypothetical protein